MNKAIFLDRDGTIIVDWIDQHEPSEVRFIHGTIQALTMLRLNGYMLILVTNQSGINRGVFTEEQMRLVNERVTEFFPFSAVYFSPEKEGEPSDYRKPSPNALLHAAKEYNIDLSQSYFIGDKITDLQCGWNAGVKRSYLVMTGFGTCTYEKIKSGQIVPSGSYHAAVDLLDAANHILRENKVCHPTTA